MMKDDDQNMCSAIVDLVTLGAVLLPEWACYVYELRT
jgi:hypothetical protein